MRENLFNGVGGTILTVVSLYVIYLILSGALPWLFNGGLEHVEHSRMSRRSGRGDRRLLFRF